LICGVYIIAFERLSKLFYSFFFDYDQNRSAAGHGSQRKDRSGGREGVWVSGCFASKTNMPPLLQHEAAHAHVHEQADAYGHGDGG
jgi:hypothetical protein